MKKGNDEGLMTNDKTGLNLNDENNYLAIIYHGLVTRLNLLPLIAILLRLFHLIRHKSAGDIPRFEAVLFEDASGVVGGLADGAMDPNFLILGQFAAARTQLPQGNANRAGNRSRCHGHRLCAHRA